jgi:hypothetical protein
MPTISIRPGWAGLYISEYKCNLVSKISCLTFHTKSSLSFILQSGVIVRNMGFSESTTINHTSCPCLPDNFALRPIKLTHSLREKRTSCPWTARDFVVQDLDIGEPCSRDEFCKSMTTENHSLLFNEWKHEIFPLECQPSIRNQRPVVGLLLRCRGRVSLNVGSFQ